jgi:hypothetical protein
MPGKASAMPCKQENEKLILSFNILIKDGGRKMPANSTKAATIMFKT